jgi:hypothetical protein
MCRLIGHNMACVTLLVLVVGYAQVCTWTFGECLSIVCDLETQVDQDLLTWTRAQYAFIRAA